MPVTDKLVEVFSRLGARGFFLISLVVLIIFILYPAFDLTFFQRGRIDQQVNVLEQMAKIEAGDEKFKLQLNKALSRTLVKIEKTPLSFHEIAGAIFHPNKNEVHCWTKALWGASLFLVFGLLVLISDGYKKPGEKLYAFGFCLVGAAVFAGLNLLIPTFYFYGGNYFIMPLISLLIMVSLNAQNQQKELLKREQILNLNLAKEQKQNEKFIEQFLQFLQNALNRIISQEQEQSSDQTSEEENSGSHHVQSNSHAQQPESDNNPTKTPPPPPPIKAPKKPSE